MENIQNTVQAKDRKPVTNIGDSVLIQVRSSFYGKLVYKNRKSGDTTVWEAPGDIQILSMRELREMKAEQVGFFKNQWLVIVGVAEGERCKATPEDICRALAIAQYYTNYIDPTNSSEICDWSEKELESRIPLLSDKAKDNLIVAISGFIADGKIDSIRKIKTLSKVLGCDFETID